MIMMVRDAEYGMREAPGPDVFCSSRITHLASSIA